MGWDGVKVPNGGREKRRVGGATIRPPHGGVCQLVVSNVSRAVNEGGEGSNAGVFREFDVGKPARTAESERGGCVRGKEVRVAPFMKGVRVGIIQGYENCNTRRGIYIVCVKCV